MISPVAPDLLASTFRFHDSIFSFFILLSALLADIAITTCYFVEKVPASYIDSLIQMIDSVSNPALLRSFAFSDLVTMYMIVTNWAGFAIFGCGFRFLG